MLHNNFSGLAICLRLKSTYTYMMDIRDLKSTGAPLPRPIFFKLENLSTQLIDSMMQVDTEIYNKRLFVLPRWNALKSDSELVDMAGIAPHPIILHLVLKCLNCLV